MAYATTSDVQARIGAYFTIGASTKPSTTQVSAWLDEASAIVDTYLTQRGYATVPVTGASDLLAMKHLVANKVARMTLVVALGEVPDELLTELGGWEEFLEAIENDKNVLVNQTPNSRFGIIPAKIYGL